MSSCLRWACPCRRGPSPAGSEERRRHDRGGRVAPRDLDRQGRHRGAEPRSGVLQEILVQEGETVAVGTVLARIGPGGATPAGACRPCRAGARCRGAEPSSPIAEDPAPAPPPVPPEPVVAEPEPPAPTENGAATGTAHLRLAGRGTDRVRARHRPVDRTRHRPRRTRRPRRTSLPLSRPARPRLLSLLLRRRSRRARSRRRPRPHARRRACTCRANPAPGSTGPQP